MKKPQIVATLAFAFMLGAAIPIIEFSSSASVSASEPTTDVTDVVEDLETSPEDLPADLSTPLADTELSGAVTVTDATGLDAALSASAVTQITLTADITSITPFTFARANNAPLELNLNGYSITNAATSGYALLVKQGNLNITGQGTISGRNGLKIYGSDQNVVDFTTVTIGEQVTIKGQIYAIALNDYNDSARVSYGAKLTLNGTLEAGYGISTNGRIANTENAPQIIISDGAVITATGYDDSTPLYAAGNATWTISKATLTGKSGLNIRSGALTLNNTTITVDGTMREPATGNNGIDGVGVVFQIEHHPSYADNVTLNINGGTYTSQNGDVFYEYGELTTARAATSVADINITTGSFTAGTDRAIFGGTIDQNNIEISGGTFRGTDATTADFADYFVGNLKLDANGNVVANTTTGGNIDTPTSPVEAPEGPSDSKEPSDSTSDDIAPETGANQRISEISAIGTAIPMVIGACCIIAMACGQKLLSRRRATARAEVEIEIDEQIADIIDEPEDEPIIERFIAEPIARHDPKVTPVDSFIIPR